MTDPTPARKRGRPAIVPGSAPERVDLKLTPEQRAKLKLLGGSAWVRRQIDKARVPKLDESTA